MTYSLQLFSALALFLSASFALAAPAQVTAGGRVLALVQGVLTASDAATGRQLWRYSQNLLPIQATGHASTPAGSGPRPVAALVFGDHVIVRPALDSVRALSASVGAPLWTAHVPFDDPVYALLGDTLFVFDYGLPKSGDQVGGLALDPRSGHELWRFMDTATHYGAQARAHDIVVWGEYTSGAIGTASSLLLDAHSGRVLSSVGEWAGQAGGVLLFQSDWYIVDDPLAVTIGWLDAATGAKGGMTYRFGPRPSCGDLRRKPGDYERVLSADAVWVRGVDGCGTFWARYGLAPSADAVPAYQTDPPPR